MQTVCVPLMAGAGCGPTTTFSVTVVSHESEFDSVSVKIPFVAVGQNTVTELLLLAVMVPPVTLHVYELPVTNGVVYVMLCPAQPLTAPAMDGVGCVRMVTGMVTVESHPYELISVKVMEALPAMFQFT